MVALTETVYQKLQVKSDRANTRHRNNVKKGDLLLIGLVKKTTPTPVILLKLLEPVGLAVRLLELEILWLKKILRR